MEIKIAGATGEDSSLPCHAGSRGGAPILRPWGVSSALGGRLPPS